MVRNRVQFLSLLTFLAAAPFHPASAQQGKSAVRVTNLAQYPSFVEISGTNGNTQFDLRCGYTAANGRITLDPSLNDFSELSVGDNAYSRYQYIDGRSVLTGPDPAAAGGNRVIVHVVEEDGSIHAKDCAWDKAGDMLSSCRNATPTIPLTQIQTQANSVASQCQQFIQKAEIDPRAYSADKTDAYKSKLSQKLAILEGP